MSFYGNNTLIRLSVCSQNLCSASKTRCYVFLNLPVVKYSLHHLILPFSCEKLIAFICYRFFSTGNNQETGDEGAPNL